MDRKIKLGYTLLELLIVLVIIAIMTSIGIGEILKWKTKRNIENDIRKIYFILQEFRIKAFVEKENYNCYFVSGGKSFVIKNGEGNIVKTVSLEESFEFKSSNIAIDYRGTFSGSSIKPLNTNIVPEYNCIAVDDTRVKLGRWQVDADTCEVK